MTDQHLERIVPDKGLFFVGETHGTNEAPRFFAELVESVVKNRVTVTVHLEFPLEDQPAFDRFMSTPGLTVGAAFCGDYSWNKVDDGRTSIAMAKLLTTLRDISNRTETGFRMICFTGTREQFASGLPGDEIMANNLERSFRDEPEKLHLVFCGSVHACTGEFDLFPVYPAAYLLKQRGYPVASLHLGHAGGSIRNISVPSGAPLDVPMEAAVHNTPSHLIIEDLPIGAYSHLESGAYWDFEYNLGTITASEHLHASG